MGRRCYIDKSYAYKAPNYLIQGGTADVVKVALVNCHKFLEGYESRMLLQIHDEILFEIALGEEHLIESLKEIMQDAYPSKYLKLTVGADYSATNWLDKHTY